MLTTFVLMAGLPGTGKSTLAGALAEATNGVVLSKDVIRAALFPGVLTDYTEEQDDLCFRALLDAATYIAHHQHPAYIFFDGRTFRKRSQVETAIKAAQDAGGGWRILYLTCPDELAMSRIAQDQFAHDQGSGGHLARNRDERLYIESKSRFEAIGYPYLQLDTSAPLQACVKSGLAYLGTDGQGSHHGASTNRGS